MLPNTSDCQIRIVLITGKIYASLTTIRIIHVYTGPYGGVNPEDDMYAEQLRKSTLQQQQGLNQNKVRVTSPQNRAQLENK